MNGTSTGFLSSSCGLRQGDALSPFLCVNVIEVLSGMIFALTNGALLSGFLVGSRHVGAFYISHILFANDTLIFCGENPDHLCNLQCLFLCFVAVSGLTINLVKSELVAFGNIINVEVLASILGCRISSFPMTYLGLSLGALFEAKSI